MIYSSLSAFLPPPSCRLLTMISSPPSPVFLTWRARSQRKQKDELELFFRALDSQGSGYISKTAWSAAVNLCVGAGQGLGVDGGVCTRMSLAKGSSNFVVVSTCFHELETDHLVQTPSSYLLSLPHSLVSSPHHHTHVQLSE